jgi:hypothetical protein
VVGGKPLQVRLTTFYSENNPPKHELFVTVKKPRLSMRKYLKKVGVTSQQTIEGGMLGARGMSRSRWF